MNIRPFFNIAIICVLVALAYFPVFDGLGKYQIHLWDESAYANNSVDMLQNPSAPLVITSFGEEDNRNTKPPLVIWLQAVSMKIFGISEWSVRFPTALFGMATVFLIYFFCSWVLKSRMIGILSTVLLITSEGFIRNHVIRTGDLDGILVFWLTLYLLVFLKIIIDKPVRTFPYFLVISIALIGGVLTKGVAGLFFVPFLFVIALMPGNRWVFNDKWLYLSAIAVMGLSLGYYIIRDLQTPGYLLNVFQSEILRINQPVMTWHVLPFDFYFQNIIWKHFKVYIFFLAFIPVLPFLVKTSSKKFRVLIYLLIISIGYFLLISFPPVKLDWYDAPLMPVLSLIAGIIILLLSEAIFEKLKVKWSISFKNLVLGLIMIPVLVWSYVYILQTVKFTEDWIDPNEIEGAYLRHLVNSEAGFNGFTILKTDKHDGQLMFYIRSFETNGRLKDVKIAKNLDFKAGETVMVSKQHEFDELLKLYEMTQLNFWHSARLVKINREIEIK